jgi:hypothetical protein
LLGVCAFRAACKGQYTLPLRKQVVVAGTVEKTLTLNTDSPSENDADALLDKATSETILARTEAHAV